MDDEFRAKQGSIIPRLFIGMGGVGSRIVDRIMARAVQLPNWDSQLRSLTSFVSIDTNELDQHKLQSVPSGNRINIAAFDKSRAIENYRKSLDKQALHWLDKGYQPRPGFKPGAGQIRLESRLGFFYHSRTIRHQLEHIIRNSLSPNNTWRQESPPKYYVYVFCTLAGGTGSGSFLSVAYLIDEIIRKQAWQPRVIGNLLLSTLVLDKVGPELHTDIHANTYAALKELEHMTKLDYDQVKKQGRESEEFVFCATGNRDEVNTVATRPFFLSFIHDLPPHLSLPNAEAAIADATYLQLFTPIVDNMAGELDNYEKNMEGLTRFPGTFRDVGLGYSKNFGAFGAVAMVLPGTDLLEYATLRFAAQAIRNQITFGLDKDSQSDARARALAKLAVNYADVKFLNASEEGREKMISEAFIASVQEMARQDAKMGMQDGYWNQLVMAVDVGAQTGKNDNDEIIRAESLLAQLERKLGEAREPLLQKVSIKIRSFNFHKEGVGQYMDQVERLKADVVASKRAVEAELTKLTTGATEGEVIAELGLDPITERYLIIQLLERCEEKWIPNADQQWKKCGERGVSSSKTKTMERLERELYASLQEIAGSGTWYSKKDDEFYAMRSEAEDYYRTVAKASIKYIEADITLKQLRALLTYIKRRTLQYARLSTHMDKLADKIEQKAERMRRGEMVIDSPFALAVEVFETMEEPRRRIWDQVYQYLFIDDGKYITTFDRNVLSATIKAQMEPELSERGAVRHKNIVEMESDIQEALIKLGRSRLKPAIFGDRHEAGLNIVRGLDIEADLMLRQKKAEDESVSDEEKTAYRQQKFRALSQLAGIMARVNSAESEALDDGVVVNRTRQLIHGITAMAESKASESFMEQLKSTMSVGGKQVKVDAWHDPRMIVIHDIETPIPLYYFDQIVGDIEESYIKQASDERRGYNLHIDFRWEKSLPNLNPRRSELTVGWAMQTLAKALFTTVFTFDQERAVPHWIWTSTSNNREDDVLLGEDLSVALYEVGEFHRHENLQCQLENQIDALIGSMSAAEADDRQATLIQAFENLLLKISLRSTKGDKTRLDTLEEPIFRVLVSEWKAYKQWKTLRRESNSRSGSRYGL